MYKLRNAFLLTIGLTVIVAMFGFLLPPPPTWTDGVDAFHFKLALALVIPALHVLAAIFFFQGLSGFKEEFRTAYRLIAVGVIIIGCSLLASPAVTFFNLWNEWPMELGVINLPFVLAVAVIFTGIRTFYRKLDVKSIWRPLWASAAFVAVGIVLAVFMPHVPSPIPELRYDLGSAFFALSALALMVTAFNIFAVRKYIVARYAKVLSWLGGGLLFESFIVAPSLVFKALGLDAKVAAGGLQDYLVLAAIPYLVAGYLFYQLTADVRQPQTQTGAGVVDVVMYTSSLVSNPTAVDKILDDLRLITARMHPGQSLADTDKAALAGVYLRLESYLTKDEKLRLFTPEQLRQQIYHRFNNPLSATVDAAFWQKVPPFTAGPQQAV